MYLLVLILMLGILDLLISVMLNHVVVPYQAYKSNADMLFYETRIFNISGKEIELSVIKNEIKETLIDVSRLLPGIYFIEFSIGERISRTKFIKE